jgi:hypothetical protein
VRLAKVFEETQYILRLRGSRVFDVLIVPHHAGTRPADLAMTRTSHGELSLIRGENTTMLPD